MAISESLHRLNNAKNELIAIQEIAQSIRKTIPLAESGLALNAVIKSELILLGLDEAERMLADALKESEGLETLIKAARL